MRTRLLVAAAGLVGLTACGVAAASGDENHPTTTKYATTTVGHTTTTRHDTTTTAAPTTTLPPTTTGPTTTVGPTTSGPTTTAAPTTSGPTTTVDARKVFVCKYVGTPGVDERLQTGDNPISVSVNAIPNPPGPNVQIGDEFADAQGRSVVIAFDVGQPEPDVSECPPPDTGTTTTAPTTTMATTTTTMAPTTTGPTTTSGPTTSGPTTTFPTPTPFAIEVEPLCPDGTTPLIEITFGDRPDLDGQTGTLTFSTGGSIPLTFDANNTVEIPYPASAGTGPVTMTYTLGAESVTRSTTFPEACAPPTTTGPTTTAPPTTAPPTTAPPTTPPPTPPTTTPPDEFAFGAAATVCVREVPTIQIDFLNRFPELAGEVGVLTMSDINGNVVSTQDLVYQPNTTVRLLYPGTRVNPDGSIADVPGWILTDDGLWIRDPSDDYLREGIGLSYTVNPTATAFVTYPPESSECANPENPPTTTTPPGPTTAPPGAPPGQPGLPVTGTDTTGVMAAMAAVALAVGSTLFVVTRRRRYQPRHMR